MGPRGRGAGQGGQQGRRPRLPGELQPGEQASGRYDDADEADSRQNQQRRRVSACHCTTRNIHTRWWMTTLQIRWASGVGVVHPPCWHIDSGLMACFALRAGGQVVLVEHRRLRAPW